jgi:hypothetical protein
MSKFYAFLIVVVCLLVLWVIFVVLEELWIKITTKKEIGYHTNGKVNFLGNKRNGERQGLFDFYDEEGKLVLQILYRAGVISQEHLIHSETGKCWKTIYYKSNPAEIDRVWINVKNASEIEKDDIDFMREAIINNPNNLQFATVKLRSNKDFIRWSVKQSPYLLEFAHLSLKSDSVFVYELIKEINNSGLCKVFEHVSDNLKNDPDFVKNLIKLDPHTFKHASNELKSNKEFILDALKRGCNTWFISHILIYISTDLFDDGDFMLSVDEILKDGFVYDYLSKRLLCDREFILKSIEYSDKILEYIPKKLQKDDEIILKAISLHGSLNYTKLRQKKT